MAEGQRPFLRLYAGLLNDADARKLGAAFSRAIQHFVLDEERNMSLEGRIFCYPSLNDHDYEQHLSETCRTFMPRRLPPVRCHRLYRGSLGGMQ